MSDHDQQVNPKKLFIGNLPWSTREENLREIFEVYGEVTYCKLITDRATGRSKGIAFVEFATEDAAQAAIDGSENLEIEGRKIIVNVARPQVPREDRGGDRGGYRGGNGGGNYRSRN